MISTLLRRIALYSAMLAVSALLLGCYRRSRVDLTKLGDVQHYKIDTMFRVTTKSDSALSLDSLTIRTDSVIGRLPDGRQTAVARAEVFRIEQRKPDVFKTIRVGAGIGLSVLLILAISQLGPM